MYNVRLPRMTVLSIYVRNVIGHALLGAVLTWALLVLTFGIVAHIEHLPFEWIPAGGFTLMCMGVGALIGGAAGVEPAQILAYDRERALRAAQPFTDPVTGRTWKRNPETGRIEEVAGPNPFDDEPVYENPFA